MNKEGYGIRDKTIPKIGNILYWVFNPNLRVRGKDRELVEGMLTTFKVGTVKELYELLNQPIKLTAGNTLRKYNNISVTNEGIEPIEGYIEVQEDDVFDAKLSIEQLATLYKGWLEEYLQIKDEMEKYLDVKSNEGNKESILDQVKELINK